MNWSYTNRLRIGFLGFDSVSNYWVFREYPYSVLILLREGFIEIIPKSYNEVRIYSGTLEVDFENAILILYAYHNNILLAKRIYSFEWRIVDLELSDYHGIRVAFLTLIDESGNILEYVGTFNRRWGDWGGCC